MGGANLTSHDGFGDYPRMTGIENTLSADAKPRAYVRFGKRRLPVPRHRSVRIGMALTIIIAGILPTPPGPVLTVPAGLAILSIDFPRLRRLRRKALVRIGRRRGRRTLGALPAPA
jgi:hypothetical protein